VPGVLKVYSYVCGPSVTVPLPPGVTPLSATTLWLSERSGHCQVTVVPTLTVMLAGLNRLPPAGPSTWTMVPPGPEVVAVAPKVAGEPVAPVTLAVAVCGPGVSPSVQLLVLSPPGLRLPSAVAQLTTMSAAGSPSRVTTTRRSLGSA
jgi:hypothetical protein